MDYPPDSGFFLCFIYAWLLVNRKRPSLGVWLCAGSYVIVDGVVVHWVLLWWADRLASSSPHCFVFMEREVMLLIDQLLLLVAGTKDPTMPIFTTTVIDNVIVVVIMTSVGC